MLSLQQCLRAAVCFVVMSCLLLWQPAATPIQAQEQTVLPPVAPTPLVSPTPLSDGRVIYTVVEGDTLITIGDRFGIHLNDLLALNGLDPNAIIDIGQPLLLGYGGRPDGSTALPGFPRARLLPNGATVHTVTAGETLGDIAILYSVTIEELLELNEGLQPERFLRVDQEIIVNQRPQPIATGASADLPTVAATATPIPTLILATATPVFPAYPSAEAAVALAAAISPTSTPPALALQQAATDAPDESQSSLLIIRLWLPILLAAVGILALISALWLYRRSRHSK